MKIEIGVHTDHRGAVDYNRDLSIRRAQNVFDYLVQNGVDETHMTAKGYGESVSLTVDTCLNKQNPLFAIGQVLDSEYIEKLDSDSLKEKAVGLNRRTEFKIINRP